MRIRTFRWSDLKGILNVINHSQEARGRYRRSDEKEIRFKLRRYFNAEKDCFVAESSTGSIVGVGTMRFLHPPGTGLVVYEILPGQEASVGSALVRATDARLMERWSGKLHPGIPIQVKREVDSVEMDKVALLEAEGYHLSGFTNRMSRALEKPVDHPELPGNIHLRPFDPRHQAKALYDFFQEVIAQESGRSYENWRDIYHLNEKFFDPTLWLIAWHGDNMVGISICYPEIHEEPTRTGWIDLIAVRYEFRRSGIGGGLLRQSLMEFQQRGFTIARARPEYNPGDVVGLLQRSGFRIENTQLCYEKVFHGKK